MPAAARRLGSDASRYNYSFKDEASGRGVHLAYDVELNQDVEILPLPEVQGVSTVLCSKTAVLSVSLASKSARDAFGARLAKVEGKRLFLTSPNVRSCGPGAFLGWVQEVNLVQNGVEIGHLDASYEDVFKKAHVDFSTSLASQPGEGFQAEVVPSVDTEGSHGRRLFFGSWNPLASVWRAAKSFASTVVSGVTLVVRVVDVAMNGGTFEYPEGLQEGEPQEFTLLSMGCTGSITREEGIKSGVLEVIAEAELTASLGFSLSVENMAVKEAGVSVGGQLQLTAEASGTGSLEWNYEKLIFTFRSPTVQFLIGGLYVTIDVEAPVNVGFEAKYEGSIKMRKTMTGGLNFEYKYRPQSDSVHQRSFTPTFTAESSVEVESGASITLYTKVAPTVSIWKIFSVSVPMKPYHLAAMDFLKSPDDDCFLKKYIGLDVDLTFRAKGIAEVNFPNVLAKQWPWEPSQAECEESRRLMDSPPLRGLTETSLVGRMWQGTVEPVPCAFGATPVYGSGQVQLQLVEERDDDTQVLMGAINLGAASWGGRSLQGGGQCSITVKFVFDPTSRILAPDPSEDL
ncbi:unnamed protein product [Symbiodinium necroappetens]|uniref:Uncharacterized protein n=1 Tax=Symbiodinium necroappetens TaxID=1628268 RepID=A0A812JUB6_9DINO|nr:unnamed protein product [Symbiodinium necroappetens]